MNLRHILAATGLGIALLGIAFWAIDGGSVFAKLTCLIGIVWSICALFKNIYNTFLSLASVFDDLHISIDHKVFGQNVAALRRACASVLAVAGLLVFLLVTIGTVSSTVNNLNVSNNALPPRQIINDPADRAAPNKPAAESIRVSRRYREKFADLYDQVKGDFTTFTTVARRDMPGLAKALRAKSAMLPKDKNEVVDRVGVKLQRAAGCMASAADLFVTQGKAEVSLRTDGGTDGIGGMSSETRRMFNVVIDGTQKQIEMRLGEAKQLIQEVEASEAFEQLMR